MPEEKKEDPEEEEETQKEKEQWTENHEFIEPSPN